MEIQHEVQLGILKELLFRPEAHLAQLNTMGLDNNHFNFHLKRLIELDLVEKEEQLYKLTPVGLELAGRMDVSSMEIVRQPKLGVCVYIENDNRILLGKRLKSPGQGIVNFFTRKVRYGEPVFETAKLCLQDETGLTASFIYAGTVRIMQPNDVLFVCMRAMDLKGELKEKTIESENKWYSFEEIKGLKNVFEDFWAALKQFRGKGLFFDERR